MLLRNNYSAILIFVLITLACSLTATAKDLNSPYLPLAVGNEWVLHSQALDAELSFEVVELNDGIYRVRLNNPWLAWEFSLFPVKNKIYIQSLQIGDNEYNMGGLSLYYDFTVAGGGSIDVDMGTMTISDANHSCATSAQTYTGCITLELVDAGGFQQSWTFAPDFGIVNYTLDGFPFVVDVANSSVKTKAPDNTVPTWSEPVDKGSRVLAIDVNENDAHDYHAAVVKAQAAGMQALGLHFDWNKLETGPGQYADLFYFEAINAYYPAVGVDLHLTIAPVHNENNLLPDDLKDLPFDHADVIARYKQLLDVLFVKIPDANLKTLVVGSEIDAYMGDDPSQWAQYENFYQQVSEYARSIRPGLKVATEVTVMQGFYGVARPFLDSINAHSDVIGLSYYPKDTSGIVLDPDVVALQFKTLAEAFPGKDLHFYQLGFPSSSVLQSSESIQADFMRNVFQAWDLYADRYKLVDFTFLHNLSDQAVDEASQEFNQDSVRFNEFLNSLGLLKFDSSLAAKEAYTVVQEESLIRGW